LADVQTPAEFDDAGDVRVAHGGLARENLSFLRRRARRVLHEIIVYAGRAPVLEAAGLLNDHAHWTEKRAGLMRGDIDRQTSYTVGGLGDELGPACRQQAKTPDARRGDAEIDRFARWAISHERPLKDQLPRPDASGGRLPFRESESGPFRMKAVRYRHTLAAFDRGRIERRKIGLERLGQTIEAHRDFEFRSEE